MAYLSGYTKRFPVTIDSTKVPADLTDFPVYFDLSNAPAGFWSTVANGGGDIRVTKSDGTTEVAREPVSCDTITETGELHFKAAGTLSSSTDTVFYIYYNGTSSDYAVTATFGRNNVWSDYAFVSHDGAQTDSTGGTTPSSVGSPPIATGQIGDATDYQNTMGGSAVDYINVNADILPTGSTGNDFTFQTWANWATTGFGVITDHQNTDIRQRLFVGVNYNGSTTTGQIGYFLRESVSDGDAVTIISPTTNPNLNDGAWHSHALVRDSALGDGGDLYLDGSSVATSFSSGSSLPDGSIHGSGYNHRFGTFKDITGFAYDGLLDEVRTRFDALSSDWITTEYNNQNNAATFYATGAEETDGGGGVTDRNAIFAFGGM